MALINAYSWRHCDGAGSISVDTGSTTPTDYVRYNGECYFNTFVIVEVASVIDISNETFFQTCSDCISSTGLTSIACTLFGQVNIELSGNIELVLEGELDAVKLKGKQNFNMDSMVDIYLEGLLNDPLMEANLELIVELEGCVVEEEIQNTSTPTPTVSDTPKPSNSSLVTPTPTITPTQTQTITPTPSLSVLLNRYFATRCIESGTVVIEVPEGASVLETYSADDGNCYQLLNTTTDPPTVNAIELKENGCADCISPTPTPTPTPTPSGICPSCSTYGITNFDRNLTLQITYTDCDSGSSVGVTILPDSSIIRCSCDDPERTGGTLDWGFINNGSC